jgi:hypothetical protein
VTQNLLHATRMLRKAPRFNLLVALILALGIGANTSICTPVNAPASQPREGGLTSVRTRSCFNFPDLASPDSSSCLDLERHRAHAQPDTGGLS